MNFYLGKKQIPWFVSQDNQDLFASVSLIEKAAIMYIELESLSEKIESKSPKIRAPLELILFLGNTLSLVLFINLSVSRSYHMFKAPDAPEPIEIASMARNPVTMLKLPGAIIMPTKLVNIDNDITLGFKREMY